MVFLSDFNNFEQMHILTLKCYHCQTMHGLSSP